MDRPRRTAKAALEWPKAGMEIEWSSAMGGNIICWYRPLPDVIGIGRSDAEALVNLHDTWKVKRRQLDSHERVKSTPDDDESGP